MRQDPGFGPAAIIEAAAGSGRYSVEEVGQLSFAGSPPDAAALARTWRRILDAGREVVSILPPEEVGACVLDPSGDLVRSSPQELRHELGAKRVHFHHGRIRGALPRLIL